METPNDAKPLQISPPQLQNSGRWTFHVKKWAFAPKSTRMAEKSKFEKSEICLDASEKMIPGSRTRFQQFEICISALRFKSGNLKRDYLFVVLFVVYNISARLHPVYQISGVG